MKMAVQGYIMIIPELLLLLTAGSSLVEAVTSHWVGSIRRSCEHEYNLMNCHLCVPLALISHT